MIIDAVGDLHGFKPELKGGDLLLLCGDYTAADNIRQWAEFFAWLKKQPYEKKVLIAGNHDTFLFDAFPKTEKQAEELAEVRELLEDLEQDTDANFEYLCDNGTEFGGLTIWGSPWSPWFSGVNPKCKAFMSRESKIANKFEKIPKDIDILVTHSPPYMILDENREGLYCGSLTLRYQMDVRVYPKYHFFGHIHEQHGKKIVFKRPGFAEENNTKCYNVSYVDENYQPMNKIRRVEI